MPAEPALTTPPHTEPAGTEPVQSEPTPAEFRRAMSEFATGVTVVTAIDGGEPIGFACQSFTSVSLEPPLILFCADRRGRSWPRIRAAGRFCVNVLGEDQRDLCQRFGSSRGRKFEDLAFDVSPWGTPALRDVLLGVHAEVQDVHPAGDHDVVIGRVLAVRRPEDRLERPMVFFRSRFGVDEPETPEAADAPDAWWSGQWGWM
ncbi:monooxygenase [Actinomadura cremea]|nr:monooxygenase [Actinomadura cremea]